MSGVVFEIDGWVASVLLVGGYLLVATRLLDAHRPLYHVINLVGSVLLVIFSIYKTAWPQLFLNLFWGVVAIVGILLAIRSARSLSKSESGTESKPESSVSSFEPPDETLVREG